MCQVKHCQYSCGHFTEECFPTSEACRYNPCKVQTVTSRIRDSICSRCKEAEKNRGRGHGHRQHKKEPTIFPPGHDAFGGQPPGEEAKFRANQLAAYRAKQDLENAQAKQEYATMDPKKHKKATEEHEWYKQREKNLYKDERRKAEERVKRAHEWQAGVARNFNGRV
ncbi:uncharacterized protein H6S33_008849 [Morchella sextelata]|uniref:uncharacterized protein n=1 Tax=Morchella sextelata TaxID=1174677 RepID=UPI001D0526BA|nr:uncharacterized protein H6S33_008849 [Morchella sextelata]KAH0612469.1 hypothetical protein H6S33_008849 [Morchella sextelata]